MQQIFNAESQRGKPQTKNELTTENAKIAKNPDFKSGMFFPFSLRSLHSLWLKSSALCVKFFFSSLCPPRF